MLRIRRTSSAEAEGPSSSADSARFVEVADAQSKTRSGCIANIAKASTAKPAWTHLFRTTTNNMPVSIRHPADSGQDVGSMASDGGTADLVEVRF